MSEKLDRFTKRARYTLLHLAHRTQAALYALKQGLVGLDEVEV
jgi:hypothetical protein